MKKTSIIKKKEFGYSLLELIVVLCSTVVLILVMASAVEIVWMHYKNTNLFNKVDNRLIVVDNYINRGIIDSGGGYYWMPVGGLGMLYMYNHSGASTIVVEGDKISQLGSWIKVEDVDLFVNKMMEGNRYINIIGSNGIKVGLLKEIDIENSRLKISLLSGENEYWVSKGDIIEDTRRLSYTEIRNGKLWAEGYGDIVDGIIAFDVLYIKGDRVGYGIVKISDTAEGIITCNYDVDKDNILTAKDDLDGNGELDCTPVEEMEPQKFDAIEYWVLGALSTNESNRQEIAIETFVVGRKIYKIPRNRYPRLLMRRINLKGFEI